MEIRNWQLVHPLNYMTLKAAYDFVANEEIAWDDVVSLNQEDKKKKGMTYILFL